MQNLANDQVLVHSDGEIQTSALIAIDVDAGSVLIGTSATSKVGFFGETPVVQSADYTVTNHTDDRAMDCDSAADAELADVLGSVILDLVAYGLLDGSVA